MKRYVCIFEVGADNMEHALTLGRKIVGDTGPDLTAMEADKRDDMRTLVDSLAMSGLAESRDMRFTAEVEVAGWTLRVEFDMRAELGAVSFIQGARSQASMVLPAQHMRDLLMGIGAFPYDMINEIAERDGHARSH